MFRFISKHIRTIAAIGVAVVGTALGCASCGGFAAGLISSGGDLKAGIIGGLTGGALTIGSLPVKIAVTAMIGGAGSVIQGGKFLSGFISGGFSAALSGAKWLQGKFSVAKLAISSIAGGIVSVLGGGKFKNGAISAALAYSIGQGVAAAKNSLSGDEIHNQILNDLDNVGEARGLYGDKILVRKYGSPTAAVTDSELHAVKTDFDSIFANGGKDGSLLQESIISPDTSTTVILNDIGGNGALTNKFFLTVDLNTQVQFLNSITNRWQQFSTTRILAHELGHAVLGKSDIGFSITAGRLNKTVSPNVNFTDRIMSGINGSIRGSYENSRICSPSC